jgi:single-stranded DNA-binding protein
MAYATLICELTTEASQECPAPGEPEACIWQAQVPSDTPVIVELRAKPGGKLATALAAFPIGARILIAGFLTAQDLGEGGQQPVVQVCMVCPASAEQFCNEVTAVGRVGGDARVAEKSAKIPLALNRYRRNPHDPEGDPEEITDWIGVRGFGFIKGKIEKLSKGTLLEVAGSLSQMKNAKGEGYFELRARSIRSHGKGKGRGAAVAPASTSAVGYGASDFDEQDGVGGGWD